MWTQAIGVAAATLVACGPAQAFYWHNWPGSGLVVQQSLITQPHQNSSANPPSATPPLIVPPPGAPGTPGTPSVPVGPPDKPPVSPPSPTPEPATGLLALLGVGAMAATRRWKRK